MVLAFVALRTLDGYGDPSPRLDDGSPALLAMSFLNLTQYPPSLLFLLMTLGPALVALALLRRARGPVADVFVTFGRASFLFYVTHLYVVHALAVAAGVAGKRTRPGDPTISQASEALMRYLLHLSTLSILVLGVPTVEPLGAQQRHRVTGAPDQLLAAFAREPESSAGADIMAMLLYNRDYPKARVEALLRGLERLALDGTTERVRAHAAELLLTSGSRQSPDPIPGSFARIERVFRHSKDSGVQVGLVNGMRVLAERKEAVRLLEQIAAQDSYLAQVALSSLLNMGNEGTAVLKRLHESKAVRSPKARGDLEAIARSGRLH